MEAVLETEKTINEYIENLLLVFPECVRILKDDGSIVFNLSDKYLESNHQLIPYGICHKRFWKNFQ